MDKQNKYVYDFYLNKILEVSNSYLKKLFTKKELNVFLDELNKKICSKDDTERIIEKFIRIYEKHIKINYQINEHPKYDRKLHNFISNNNDKIKILWGNCLDYLKQLPAESVQLMVTSPPYYNAREYTKWRDLKEYLNEMKETIKQCYRVLDNHRIFVFNVGDVFDNDNIATRSVWGKRRLPLGAYFIMLFEECGFTFVDDFIWDKGEVQSQRHKDGDKPFPFYQYPLNCYEHILVFHKHRLDTTRFPCPVCGCLKVNGNTQSEIGLQSWECKNYDCFVRSKSNRGKRFSLKTNIAQNKTLRKENKISGEIIKKWRRDIVKFSPVIKINSKGQNRLGHSAPFPEDIPEISVKIYTYKGEKVLDPFAGSFTTAIVANKLDRIGIGCENRKDLYEKAIKKNIKNKGLTYEEFQLKQV